MKVLNTLYADIFYDNATSGLTATTLKNAIDELSGIANVDISAATVTLDNSNFTGLLSASDDDMQSALDILDAVDAEAIPYDNSTSNLIADNVNKAIDVLYQLLFPEISEFSGGSPDTNDFVYTLEGGDPSSSEPDQTVDGGDPQNPGDGG